MTSRHPITPFSVSVSTGSARALARQQRNSGIPLRTTSPVRLLSRINRSEDSPTGAFVHTCRFGKFDDTPVRLVRPFPRSCIPGSSHRPTWWDDVLGGYAGERYGIPEKAKRDYVVPAFSEGRAGLRCPVIHIRPIWEGPLNHSPVTLIINTDTQFIELTGAR